MAVAKIKIKKDFYMLRRREIITAIEIATSKIRVLVGEAGEKEHYSVLGYYECNTKGGVIKGEITDINVIVSELRTIINKADAAIGFVIDRNRIFLSLSNDGIRTTKGMGVICPINKDGRVSINDLHEAQKNAQNHRCVGYDRIILNSFKSVYLLDGRPVHNPVGQTAEKLEVLSHIIHGNTKQIKNYINVLQDLGFNPAIIHPVFSAAVAAFGILTVDERTNGILLIDVGAGTTEAVVIYHDGMQASCVIPVGFDHVANDLSIGLDLHISTCRALLDNGSVQEAKKSGVSFIEIRERVNTTSRKVFLDSIDKIVLSRLQEVCSIIRKKLEKENPGIISNLAKGCVLTGGGSMYNDCIDVCKEEFGIPVRCGAPILTSATLPELISPRCSVIWGTFCYGLEMRNILGSKDCRNIIERGIDTIDLFAIRTLEILKGVLKK